MTLITLLECCDKYILSAGERKWEKRKLLVEKEAEIKDFLKFKSDILIIRGASEFWRYGHPRQGGTTLCAASKVWEGKSQ